MGKWCNGRRILRGNICGGSNPPFPTMEVWQSANVPDLKSEVPGMVRGLNPYYFLNYLLNL